MMYFTLMLVGFVPIISALFLLVRKHDKARAQATRKLMFGMSAINIVIALFFLSVAAVWLFAPEAVAASSLLPQATNDPYRSLAAGLAVGLGSIGAGVAVSSTGSAAIGAIAEKPETFGRALIFVGLSEGVAIYGLIIAFIILNG